MKVLVACEFSGIVRDAFRARGHDAWSCDLLPTDAPGPHIKGDVLCLLGGNWDLMIAHPPCTYLANAGLHYLKTKPGREQKLKDAFEFIKALWRAPIKQICIENPTGWLNTHWQKPDQIIQPYFYGVPALKTTCLWLKNLPKLRPTQMLERPKPIKQIIRKSGRKKGQIYNYYWRQGKSAKERSRTFAAVAEAMAEQWGYTP